MNFDIVDYDGRKLIAKREGSGWIVAIEGIGRTMSFSERADAFANARKIVDNLGTTRRR